MKIIGEDRNGWPVEEAAGDEPKKRAPRKKAPSAAPVKTSRMDFSVYRQEVVARTKQTTIDLRLEMNEPAIADMAEEFRQSGAKQQAESEGLTVDEVVEKYRMGIVEEAKLMTQIVHYFDAISISRDGGIRLSDDLRAGKRYLVKVFLNGRQVTPGDHIADFVKDYDWETVGEVVDVEQPDYEATS